MKTKRSTKPSPKFLRQVVNSWWVVVFLIVVYCLGLKSFAKKQDSILNLKNQVAFLSNQKDLAMQKKYDLERQIISQKDPAFVEMILMKRLGVVPEGHVKICFKKSLHEVSAFYEEL